MPAMTTSRPALSHVAFACRDLDATHRFYTEVIGLRLIHTDVSRFDKGWFRHVFFDLGDGSALAFFDLHGVGEPDPVPSAISTDLGLPLWVNHVALRVDEAGRDEIVARLEATGGKALGTVDHHWMTSTYLLDPNGILVELSIDEPGIPDEPDVALAMLSAGPEDAAPPKPVRAG